MKVSLFVLTLCGLVYGAEWKYRNFDQNDARAIVATKDGGYVVAINVRDEEKSDPVVLQKYAANGQVTWETSLVDMGAMCGASCLAELANGDLVVLGSTTNGSTAPRVERLTADGEVAWSQKLEGAAGYPAAVAVTAKSEIVVAANGYYRDSKSALYKLDGEGNSAWANAWAFDSVLSAVAVNEAGEIVVGGSVKQNERYVRSISKYGTDGTKIWGKSDDLQSHLASLVRLPDGYVALSTVGDRTMLSRYSEDGKVRWQRFFDKLLTFTSVRPMGDGFVLAGWRYSTPDTNESAYTRPRQGVVAKVGARGADEWSEDFLGTDADKMTTVNAVTVNKDGDIGVAATVTTARWTQSRNKVTSYAWAFVMEGTRTKPATTPAK